MRARWPRLAWTLVWASLIIGSAALTYRQLVWRPSRDPTVQLFRGALARPEAGLSWPRIPDVRHQPGEFSTPGPTQPDRDLFRFRPREVARWTPGPASSPVLAGPQPPATSPIATVPTLGLKYMGFVEARGIKAAGLVDPEGHIVLCLEAHDCDGRYHVWRIGVESVDISVPRRKRPSPAQVRRFIVTPASQQSRRNFIKSFSDVAGPAAVL